MGAVLKIVQVGVQSRFTAGQIDQSQPATCFGQIVVSAAIARAKQIAPHDSSVSTFRPLLDGPRSNLPAISPKIIVASDGMKFTV